MIYNLQINSDHCWCLDPVSETHAAPHFHWLWKMHHSPEQNKWTRHICLVKQWWFSHTLQKQQSHCRYKL